MYAKKTKIPLPAIIAVVSALLILVIVLLNFTFVAGGMYFKHADTLDLRKKDISLEDYQEISAKFPDSVILWNVPFQGGALSSDETTIHIEKLTDADVQMLDYMTSLTTIHAENCKDYPQLAQLQQRHPKAEMLVSVTISGKTCDQNTRSLELTGLTAEDARKLGCLSKLEQVSVSGCEDYAMLTSLQQENPRWNLTYTVALGSEAYPWDATAVTAENVDFASLENALTGLPMLTALELKNPDAEASQLLQLRQDYPDVQIRWEVDVYGHIADENTTELDISGVQVESCEAVERLVACLPNLEKLIMSDCGIDNETMAAYRERQRDNYKVVWTIYFTDKCKARTDDTYFMPTKQREFYFKDEHTPDLKYLEDVIAIDLGHHAIRNIEFVKYMPKLKYLVLAHTDVRDFSPIVHCQELVFLEVGFSAIPDFTPLTELRKLEDLNINHTFIDVEPLTKMTWLKNLFAPGKSQKITQMLQEALPNTRVETRKTCPEGEDWRDLQNYFDSRDVLGMPYMN